MSVRYETDDESHAVNSDNIVPTEGDGEKPAEPGRPAPSPAASTTPSPSPAGESSASATAKERDEPAERERRLKSLQAEIARLRGE